MQGMASELNMYESQVQEYKYEIERLARELQGVKKKYYTQKRKEQQQRLVSSESEKLDVNLLDLPFISYDLRFIVVPTTLQKAIGTLDWSCC